MFYFKNSVFLFWVLKKRLILYLTVCYQRLFDEKQVAKINNAF